jgi:hypothetical protein
MDALIFSLLYQLSPAQKYLFVMIMWRVWKRRNLKLWQQQNETILHVVDRAKNLLDDWRAAQGVRSNIVIVSSIHQSDSSSSHGVEWTKLTCGRYKCNIDASFSSSLNMVGISICLRDDLGEFVLSKTGCFFPLCDVDVGEVVSLHMALKWLADLQYDNVDFDLNSKPVVDRFKSNVEDSNELG